MSLVRRTVAGTIRLLLLRATVISKVDLVHGCGKVSVKAGRVVDLLGSDEIMVVVRGLVRRPGHFDRGGGTHVGCARWGVREQRGQGSSG